MILVLSFRIWWPVFILFYGDTIPVCVPSLSVFLCRIRTHWVMTVFEYKKHAITLKIFFPANPGTPTWGHVYFRPRNTLGHDFSRSLKKWGYDFFRTLFSTLVWCLLPPLPLNGNKCCYNVCGNPLGCVDEKIWPKYPKFLIVDTWGQFWTGLLYQQLFVIRGV